MKCDALVAFDRAVVLPQPAHEIAHFDIPPHPGRKPRKRRPLGRRILKMPHVMIDSRRVGPVGFDRDKAKALFDDEIAGDALAHPIEFGGAVGRLAEQHDPGWPNPFQTED